MRLVSSTCFPSSASGVRPISPLDRQCGLVVEESVHFWSACEWNGIGEEKNQRVSDLVIVAEKVTKAESGTTTPLIFMFSIRYYF